MVFQHKDVRLTAVGAQVETIGDCYFCATGMPEKDLHHADNMLRMALDMLVRSTLCPRGWLLSFRLQLSSAHDVVCRNRRKQPSISRRQQGKRYSSASACIRGAQWPG